MCARMYKHKNAASGEQSYLHGVALCASVHARRSERVGEWGSTRVCLIQQGDAVLGETCAVGLDSL